MKFSEMPEHVRKAANFEYSHLQEHAKRKKPVSHKTIFYMKEYGPHSHVVRKIVHESLRVLLLAALLASVGGIALERVKDIALAIVPLVILLPTLNDLVGDFGTIVSARFSAMLHEGKISGEPASNPEMRRLFLQIFVLGVLFAAVSAVAAVALSFLSGQNPSLGFAARVVALALLDVVLLVFAIFVVTVTAGTFFFRKGEDPNNFLIPIVTSAADFVNLLVIALLVRVLF